MAHWAVFFVDHRAANYRNGEVQNFGQESKKKLLGIDGNENFNLKQ